MIVALKPSTHARPWGPTCNPVPSSMWEMESGTLDSQRKIEKERAVNKRRIRSGKSRSL